MNRIISFKKTHIEEQNSRYRLTISRTGKQTDILGIVDSYIFIAKKESPKTS